MIKDKKIYCSHCGTEEGTFIKYSTNRYGHVYYHCRECNTERAREYRKTEAGKLATRKAVYKSVKKHWVKQKARLAVYYAVRKGKIVKPKECSQCHKPKKIEGHHVDYLKPLEVIWTCKQCHVDLDKALVKC